MLSKIKFRITTIDTSLAFKVSRDKIDSSVWKSISTNPSEASASSA